jgi:subtilisin family serine protease
MSPATLCRTFLWAVLIANAAACGNACVTPPAPPAPPIPTEAIAPDEGDTAAPEPPDHGKLSADLATAMATATGPMPVIARLAGDWQVDGTSGADAPAQRERIAAAGEALGKLMHGVDATWPTIPYVALTVDAEGLKRLEASAMVARVDRLDQRAHLTGSVDCNPADVCDGDPRIDLGLGTLPVGIDGTGWNVVVLDTGFDTTGVLAGRVTDSACFTNGQCVCGTVAGTANSCTAPSAANAGCGTNPAANCGHGTAVASIITNATGAPGIAPGARLLPIRVFGNGDADFRMVDLLSAVSHVSTAWTGEYKIAAVNLSLELTDTKGKIPHWSNQEKCRTWGEGTKALWMLVDELRAKGIPVVVSAGNEGLSTRVGSPACLSNVVSVGGATPSTASCCVWSQTNMASFLTVMAPSHCVAVPITSSSVVYPDGTSFAAPAVAGAYALLRQETPAATLASLTSGMRGSAMTCTSDTTDSTPKRSGKLLHF